MATGQAQNQQLFDLSSPETATHWSDVLMLQITNDQHYCLKPENGLVGEGQNFALCYDKGLKANDGGTIHKTLMFSFKHRGRKGSQTMRGHEGGFDTASFEYSISDYRGGASIKRPLSEKLVAFNVLDNYSQLMTEWCWRRDWYIMLALLAGYTADAGSGWTDHTGEEIDVSDSDIFTRGNAIRAPAANYSYKGTAANERTNDEDVVAGDELDLATINLMERKIRTAKFPLRPPFSIDGNPIYPWFIGPKTFESLQNDTGVTDIWHSLLQGGYIKKNPFFNYACGAIRCFVFFVIDDMPPGVHSSTNAAVTTVERSVILGANAVSMAFPKGFNPGNRWKMITGTDDGGWEKFMHVAAEGGWATTYYTDPADSSEIQFKWVCTHYTG